MNQVIEEICVCRSIDDGFKLVALYEDDTEGDIGLSWYPSFQDALDAAEEIGDRQPNLVALTWEEGAEV